MRNLITYLSKQSKLFFILLGILLAILVGIIDIATLDFSMFGLYLIPIVITTWFSGRMAGNIVAFVTAVSEIIGDIAITPQHSSHWVHYWNFFMNFSVFLLVVYFLLRLKESMEIKSKFTSTVSHELRTPLSVIKESINMVREGLYGSINDKQENSLNTAARNANRLNLLINDILDFQKFESSKMKFVFEENDINEVVQEAYKGIEVLVKEKGINFVFDMGRDLPKIKFDKDRIIQVITNLLGNAIKFTDKGTITVSTTKNGSNVQVAVQDTGRGIKPVDMPKLFKSFEQLGASSKRGEKGTGLGLAISKDIIVNHGGKIWAESEFGIGTVFCFTLPIME